MMATTLIPPAAAPAPTARGVRFVAIRASLLPDEIVGARRTLVVRKQVLLGLAVLVALLVAGYGYSWFQTSAAKSDLDAAQTEGITYQSQQKQFSGLVQAQSDVQSIQSELHTLMADDLQWKTMLTTIRAQAPNGVAITTIGGTVSATGDGAATSGILNQSGKPAVGTLTLSGTAPDKRTVAAFADRLAKAKGLAAPFISSVTSAEQTVTFSMSVIITSDALGGRYAVAATNPTGGN